MSFIAPFLLVLSVCIITLFLVVGLVSLPSPVLVILLGLGLLATQRILRSCPADVFAPAPRGAGGGYYR
jgi:hypothetical protein